MKKPGIVILIVLIVVVIVVIIVLDLQSGRTGNLIQNKNELNIDDYSKIDPSLIAYKEVRKYNIKADSLHGIAFHEQKIYVVADSFLQIFNLNGKQLLKAFLPYESACLDVETDGKIVIGFRNRLGLYDENGEQIWISDTLNSKAIITAVAIKEQLIFVADAGNKVVHRYDISGKYIDFFKGRTGEENIHGFIVPSAIFDLKINRGGELWIVNPGKHSFENYTYEGEWRVSWGESSVKPEGFSGCCNPAHFAFLPDGYFITSEKGIIRIKVYKPSGEFLSVVASPEKFDENGRAPDVAADNAGNVYALDYDRKAIRVFAPK